jgi:hypothetical protein
MGGQARLRQKSYAFLLSPAGCSSQCFTAARRVERTRRDEEHGNNLFDGRQSLKIEVLPRNWFAADFRST